MSDDKVDVTNRSSGCQLSGDPARRLGVLFRQTLLRIARSFVIALAEL